jgi:hypothetical protein
MSWNTNCKTQRATAVDSQPQTEAQPPNAYHGLSSSRFQQPQAANTQVRTCPQRCLHNLSRGRSSHSPPRVATPSGTRHWCSPHPTLRGKVQRRPQTRGGSWTHHRPGCRWRHQPRSSCRSCAARRDQWPEWARGHRCDHDDTKSQARPSKVSTSMQPGCSIMMQWTQTRVRRTTTSAQSFIIRVIMSPTLHAGSSCTPAVHAHPT